ncbi:hypothetical protein NBRC116583_25370 [Arenicella sp. 4NH20-0111]|uniref:hypothetical protein n=1 Tax=Arenicella sp. 4NH20-0111 TaxID=3127648 RepID=UPI00310ABCBE
MKAIGLTTFLLITFCAFSYPAHGAESVAMIADLEGQGTILNGGNSAPAGILVEVEAGSELGLQEGSSLTLFYFASSEEYTYKGPVKLLVDDAQPTLLSGEEGNRRNLNLTKLADIASEDEDNIGLGVLKLRNFEKPKLQLLTPVDTSVIADQIRFTWSEVDGAKTYKFILSNELGKKIVDQSVNKTWIELPSDSKLTSGEEYTWEIIAKVSEQSEYRAHAYFNIAEDYIASQVESSRPAKTASFSEQVVYARLLEKLGLKQDAQEIWRELVTLKPNSKLLQQRTAQNQAAND